MSTEIEKLPQKFDPTLTFRGGQYELTVQDHNGTVFPKIVSPAAVREAFTLEVIDSGWLPDIVRRYGVCRFGEWFVGFIPPGRHELPLESDEEGAQRGMIKITTPLPGLIFFGCNTKYFLWAVGSDTFDPKSEVFHAPLPHVEMDKPTAPAGLICWGYHQPQKCRAATFMKAWKLFMETPFSNHTVDSKSKKYPEDVRLMLREVAALPEGSLYPVEDLMPLHPGKQMTVEFIIKMWLQDEPESGDAVTDTMLQLFDATRQ
ncbi:MAG TPA: hypothetical protein VF708_19780 [Pyrinomonadaceae bacterium]|jgi:hypothetical protein